MFNYIKWELKDFIKSGYKIGIAIAVLYLLYLIVPIKLDENNLLINIIVLLFSFVLMISLFGSYFVGTYKVTKTFSKKTFLLESMIPQSVKKLLIGKYCLGIITNIIFLFIALLGMIVIIFKGAGADAFKILQTILEDIDVPSFFRVSFTLLLSSVSFMAVGVMIYIIIKCLFPKSNNIIVGIVLGIVTLYIVAYYSNIFANFEGNSGLYLMWLALLGIIVVCYFITAFLIERKLEIYN